MGAGCRKTRKGAMGSRLASAGAPGATMGYGRHVGLAIIMLLASAACSTAKASLVSTTGSAPQTSASDPVTYTARNGVRGMKVTVPSAGWTVYEDHPGEFTLSAADRFRDTKIHFRLDPLAFSTKAEPIPGVGGTPNALIAWLRHHPDLVVSPPRPVTIAGHVAGMSVDVGLSEKAVSMYPGCELCVDFLYFQGGNIGGYGIAGKEVLGLYLATLKNGGEPHTLEVDVDAPDAATLHAVTPIAEHIIASVVLPATVSAG